jgi:hypothetical protein
MTDKTCIFVNTNGFPCPRLAVENQVCYAHMCRVCGQLTVKPGFCIIHSESDVHHNEAVTDDTQYPTCEYIDSSGQHCSELVKDYSSFCHLHRCQHGSKTFRGDGHCSYGVMDGHKYCLKHCDSCDCYCDEDYCGGGVCCEDIQQCSHPYEVEQPHRMCQYHYQLYQFNQSPEYI